MDLDKFIVHFADQFDDIDINEFKPETKFRELDGWSSVMALFVISMIDEEYKVTLQDDELKAATTIGDLFDIVQSKL